MKSKLLFFSLLLITCVFTSCGLIKKEVDDPTTPTYYTLAISAGEGGQVNSNVNGKYKEGEEVKIIATANSDWQFRKWSDGDVRATRTLIMNKNYTLTASFEKKSSDPTENIYYIKHPWGTGLDSSWEWVQMTKVGSNYECEGLWGSVGANINTTPSDAGADWFPTDGIAGSSSLYIGDGVRFTYNPNQGTLTANKTSDGGGSSAIAKVRINCLSIWEKIAWGLIDDATQKSVLLIDFSGTKGISDYYDINVSAGHTYTLYWTNGEMTSLVGGIGSGVYGEKLEKGHKYTYTVSGDGESRTDDGTF